MIRRQDGFTLVELMITIVIFTMVIIASSQIFTALLGQYKQQSKIAETSIEGVVGLDILRRDIEHAGYGLPWCLGPACVSCNTGDPNCASYREIGNVAATSWTDRQFSDGPPTNPSRDGGGYSLNGFPADSGDPMSNPPAAFRSGDGQGLNGSDVLVIKSTNVAQTAVSQKWTYVNPGNTVKKWDVQQERLADSDRVTVLTVGTTRTLAWLNPGTGNTFTTRYVSGGPTLATNDSLVDAGFAPPDETQTRIAYGVASASTDPLRMPFNRADYYVRVPAVTDTIKLPSRCATGTGILYKAIVKQTPLGAGAPADTTTELPLLDCVADMQVQYFRDTDNNLGNGLERRDGDISSLTAAQIRAQLREVRVYILAQEGQKDPNYTFTNFTGGCATCMRVGTSSVEGHDFDLSTIAGYQNYRWKIYTIAAQPVNLR